MLRGPQSSILQNNSCTATYPNQILQTNQEKWAWHAGHLQRSEDEVSDVLLWAFLHGQTNVGLPAKTYIHQLCADTGDRLNDLQMR